MTRKSVLVLLGQMKEAATLAITYIDGLGKADFLNDSRTQQAVTMNLIIIGEVSSRVINRYSDFAQRHPEFLWQEMKGLRNRIAHGYFEINQETVWEAASLDLPDLVQKMTAFEGTEEFHELQLTQLSENDD
jgi:uncharacterized protein with HEPN domain